MSSELKNLVKEMWKAGLKKEAKALAQIKVARGMSNDDRDLQFRIFNKVLSNLGVGDQSNLFIDMKKSQAVFDVSDMGLTEFPRFLERLLRQLAEIGTKDYKLDRVDRKDPTRVYIKI